jgi:hypothetical protein
MFISIVLFGVVILSALTVVYGWFNLSIRNESNFRISDFEIDILISDDDINFNTQLKPNEPLFDFDGKYSLEPGDTQTKYLKIINNGDIPVAYELKFNGVGNALGNHIFVDISKNSNTTSLIGTELSTASFGNGEELETNDYVIYSLTVTYNASLEESQSLNGETFKLETIISAWQFNYDESKPTIESIEVLGETYSGWVEGENHIIISYDTSNMLEIKIEPEVVGSSVSSNLFVEYIKVDDVYVDIDFVHGVDPDGEMFHTVPLVKDVVTFSNYRYESDGVLSIRVPGQGNSLGTEYILVDVNDADTVEVYLRSIEPKEKIEFTVTKTQYS